MKHRFLSAVLSVLACAMLNSCDDDTPGIVTPTPIASAGEGSTGASLYAFHCATCHGLDGRPLIAATDDLLDYRTPRDTFNLILNDGPGLMPRYAHFDSARRDSIYDYIVRTFKR